MKTMKWKSCMTQLKKFLKMEKVTQTSYWGTGIALLEMSHIGTLLEQLGPILLSTFVVQSLFWN